MVTELIADRFLIFAREIEHRRVKVDTDDLALRADNLSDDITRFAAPRSQIEHCLARVDVSRWIAASIVFVDNLLRDDSKQTIVVTYGQAKTLLEFLSG